MKEKVALAEIAVDCGLQADDGVEAALPYALAREGRECLEDVFNEGNILLSSKESGEPHASLRSKNLCGRYGLASPSSAVYAGRYPGTRPVADPVNKVAKRGALPCTSLEMVETSE